MPWFLAVGKSQDSKVNPGKMVRCEPSGVKDFEGHMGLPLYTTLLYGYEFCSRLLIIAESTFV